MGTSRDIETIRGLRVKSLFGWMPCIRRRLTLGSTNCLGKKQHDEAAGLELAVAQANVQQSIPEAMTSAAGGGQKYASLLSDQGMSNQIDGNAFITKMSRTR